MATKRQDELEVAAVAGDSASEFAFVTDPHIDRTDVAADADASKEVALLLTRRDDVEAVLGVAIEEAGEPGRVASEAVAIANVEFWNHAADLSCPLQATGEEAVVGLGAVDRQGRAIAVVLGEPIELGVDIVVVEVRGQNRGRAKREPRSAMETRSPHADVRASRRTGKERCSRCKIDEVDVPIRAAVQRAVGRHAFEEEWTRIVNGIGTGRPAIALGVVAELVVVNAVVHPTRIDAQDR